MEYPIYTYGGGDLLIAVFNAIAMIFKSDSKYLTPVGTMSMTLGGVYIAIKAIFKGDIGMFTKSWMIPSMVAFIFLFSPKATVWIKDEVAMNAPTNVANIPFGIAFFTSLSSNVSHHLSKLMEETMLPANNNGATQTGILYGAKAVAKFRDVQIQDPTLLQNTKEYMRQCYMKPYVIGNFGGRKSKAQKSTDILGFLETNPAKCFGIKPINEDGSVGNFMTCTDAGKMIKQSIEKHSKDANLMSKFGAAIGIKTSDQGAMTNRIKAMTTNTLSYLDETQTEVHEWMKQAMTLNANRESYDDWRQKVGHPRVFPELVKMQATRGIFQQSLGSIVGAEMAESMIPAAAQPVMLALVVMAFVIILPFALLPGGWSYIVTGIKLMIWVCSWPLFYTIIHAIVMIQIKDAVGGWGESGLSLIGQGGFTELLLMKYAAAQSMVTSVPFISFAIVFGSPYALSSIAGAVAGTSGSASIGANMADGNLAMAQRSYNTLNRDQENYAPSLTMGGGIIDDGEMRVQSDARGNMVITEHTDNMADNHRSSEQVSGSISTTLNNAKSHGVNVSDRHSTQTSFTDAENVDVAKNVARGTTHAEGLTLSETETLRRQLGVTDSSSTSDSTGDSKSTGTNSHIDAKTPGALGALTGVSAGTSTTASNSKDVKHDLTEQERQEAQVAMDKIRTAARTGGLTSTNSDDIRLNKSFASNLSKLDQISHEKAQTMQDIDTLSKQLSYVQTNSGTIDRNANDRVMKEVMHQHPELHSKEQAARWMKSHRSETDAIARPIINDSNPFPTSSTHLNYSNSGHRAAKLDSDTQNLRNEPIATEDSLKQKHKENTAKVQEYASVKDDTGVEKPLSEVVNNTIKDSKKEYNKDVGEVLTTNLNPQEKESVGKVRGVDGKLAKTKGDIKEAKAKTYGSTIVRVVESIGDDSTAVVNGATDAVDWVVDKATSKK